LDVDLALSHADNVGIMLIKRIRMKLYGALKMSKRTIKCSFYVRKC